MALRRQRLNAHKIEVIHYFNMKAQSDAQNAQIKKHSNEIYSILDRHNLYTTPKLIPAALLTEHRNQISTFHRNFVAGKIDKVQQGYYSDSQQLKSRMRPDLTTAAGSNAWKDRQDETRFSDLSMTSLNSKRRRVLSESVSFETMKRKLLNKYTNVDNIHGYKPRGYDWRCMIEQHAKSVKSIK